MSVLRPLAPEMALSTNKQGMPSSVHFHFNNSFLTAWYRIQNPLHGIPRDTLLSQVEAFAREQGMEDIEPLLKKGALIAQSPKDFESLPELDEADKAIIRRETTRQ